MYLVGLKDFLHAPCCHTTHVLHIGGFYWLMQFAKFVGVAKQSILVNQKPCGAIG